MFKKLSSPEFNPEKELSLIGHLDELRYRLMICIAALFIATMVSWFFARPVMEVLAQPVTSMTSPEDHVPKGKPDSAELLVDPNGIVHLRNRQNFSKVEWVPGLHLLLLPSADNPTTHTLAVGPKIHPKSNIVYSNPMDPIMMPLKVSIAMGIVLSLGVWIWQIWLFVSPGLTDKEKRVVKPLLIGALFLFPLGATFAYFMLFFVMRIMQTYKIEGIEILYSVGSYLKLLTTLMVSFGVVFELPLIIALLARIGIVTPAFLSHYRRHIYVALALISMIITPGTDPISMVAVLIPLAILFEISVWVARPMALMRLRDEEEDGPTGSSSA